MALKTTTLLIQFLLLTIVLRSQQHPYTIRFSHQIEKNLAEDSIRPSRAATLYSLIGEYHLSNTYSDIPISWGVDSLDLSRYRLEPALLHIVEEAKKHKVVIISENHLKPQHRIFAKAIISTLSNYGFKHLGLETLTKEPNDSTLLDSMLCKRGYPLDSPITGTYTMEPKMGDLVRTAIKMDYQLFAYERIRKVKGKDRDEIQADNIITYLNENPDSKVVLLCGFHHAIESDLLKRGKSFWMAKYLKDKTGLDPLTIYQDNFTEKFIENEHTILKDVMITRPSVFVSQDGALVKISNQVDIEVVHPKTIYKNGRPNWLYENGERFSIKVDLQPFDIDYPVIVSAYIEDEVNSVPLDRIELKHIYDNKSLVLGKGKFRIVINDGVEVHEYYTVVK